MSSVGRLDYKAQQKEPAEKPAAAEAEGDNEQQKVQQVVQAAQNSETSLRHLFYLEYKSKFPEGKQNPIVYSRFGKCYYNSDQKFDTNNFN